MRRYRFNPNITSLESEVCNNSFDTINYKIIANLLKNNYINFDYFDRILSILPDDKIDNFTNYVFKNVKKIRDLDFKFYFDDKDNNNSTFEQAYNIFSELQSRYKEGVLKRVYDDIMKYIIELFESIPVNKNSRLKDIIEEISNYFSLDQFDKDLLYYIFIIKEKYSNIYEDCIWSLKSNDNYQFGMFASIMNLSTGDFYNKFNNSNLIKKGILVKMNRRALEEDFIETEVFNDIYLSKIIKNVLYENCDLQTSLRSNFVIDENETLPLDYFRNQDENSKKIIINLLKSNVPSSILIYGKPGTGKTEFARSIARETGKKVVLLKTKSPLSILITLNFAMNYFKAEDSIIIADEADDFLNTKSFNLFSLIFGKNSSSKKDIEKNIINDFLDNIKTHIIFISNEVSGIDESNIRRFDYSIFFDSLTLDDIVMIWKNQLKNHSLKKYFTNDIILELSSKYDIQAAGVALTLKNLEKIVSVEKKLTRNKVKEFAEIILEKHTKALSHSANYDYKENKKENNIKSLTKDYDLSIINTNIEAEKILNIFNNASNNIFKKGSGTLNLCALFWGLSGSGKTELAKYIADKLKLPLFIYRYSDLVSAYVGETEKNIANMFKSCQNKKGILFIDEADSLFYDRNNAVRSYEINQTNELLTWIENYKGIIICGTNLIKIVDNAVMRRFQLKIEFKDIIPEKRVYAFNKFFKDFKLPPLTEKEKDEIYNLDGLVPGDLFSVKSKYLLDDSDISNLKIINDLKEEIKYKQLNNDKKLGFVK